METGLVNIIIPTRNRAALLQQALDSVYAQSYRDFEVIVVDDGSQDNTRELVTLYDSRLRYLTQAHAGAAAARNLGIREAQGEFIAFLDDDDLFAPQKLQRCVAHLQANPDSVWLCSGFAFIDGAGNAVGQPVIPAKPEVTLHDIALFPLIDTSSVMIRAQGLAATQGFPEDFTVSEDYCLWAELLKHGKGLALQEILACFRLHKGNTKLPYQKLLKANTAIIDAILKTPAPGLMPRDTYIQNLHRIIAESLLYRHEYLQYALFRLSGKH